MQLLFTSLLIGLSQLSFVAPSCFCNGLCPTLVPGCRYGEEIRRITENREVCYAHCQDTFMFAAQQAACLKGCLSDGCSLSTVQKWSKSIKEFFSSSSQTQSESLIIVDNSKNSVAYSLYLNGQAVYSKNVTIKNNQIISYTFMSWTVFDGRFDLIMSLLALLCFVLGVLLIVIPCFEEDECEHQEHEKELRKQDQHCLAEEDDMKKNLLADYC